MATEFDKMDGKPDVIVNRGAQDSSYSQKIDLDSKCVMEKDGDARINFTTADIDDENAVPMHLAFVNVSVKVGEKILLKNVSGEVRPGEILAIMGPSGAGKTTLLNLLAGRRRKSGGESVEGAVTVNGAKATKRLRRRIGYVLQEDCFFSHLTVKQTLQFAGELRLPDSLPRQKKIKKVEELMACLGLKKCENTEMGGGIFVKGISGGERKRTSIAVEMITNPSLLLMDEPTSGLDSSTAHNLISTLRTLARSQNRAIVATIHQPSSQLFHLFDKLLLLCNGQVAYFGETLTVVDFFSSINMPCYPNWNPADFYMEKLTAGPEIEQLVVKGFQSRRESSKQTFGFVKGAILDSHEVILNPSAADGTAELKITNGKFCHELSDLRSTSTDTVAAARSSKKKKPPKWPTSFKTQLRVLCARAFHQTKSDLWDKLGFTQTTTLAIIVGLIWWDTPHREESVRDKQGVLYFMSIYLSFNPIFLALFTFPAERSVIAKERAAGMYRLSAYFFAKCVSELPLILFQPFIFHAIVYWFSGMNRSVYYLLSLLIVFQTVFFAQSLGLFISALVKQLKKSMTVAVITGITSILLGGFYNQNIPAWLKWLRYLSYTTYTYNALLRVDFFYDQTPFSCARTQSTFSKCLLRTASGLNETQVFITGQELYTSSRSISFGVGESLAVLFGASIVLRIGCYMGLKFFNKPG